MSEMEARPNADLTAFSAAAQAQEGSSMPHSVEAEQSVLGGLMQDAGHFDAVTEVLSELGFFQSGTL